MALGLWPEEFPSESKKIREHVQACTECRNELLMMERVAGMLRKYRAELAPVLSECPSAEDITGLAAGDNVDPSVLSHLECCEHCRDEVRLAQKAL